MKKLALTLALVVSGFANAHENDVHVENCVIQAAIPGAEMTGAFLNIEYSGDTAKALISAEINDVSKTVEIHEMTMADGVMKMQQIDKFPLKRGINKLEKGGYHLMLTSLDKRPQVGENYEITLNFDSGESESCDAAVKAPEDIHSKMKKMDGAMKGEMKGDMKKMKQN